MRALLAGYIGASAQGQNPIQRRRRTGRAGSQCFRPVEPFQSGLQVASRRTLSASRPPSECWSTRLQKQCY